MSYSVAAARAGLFLSSVVLPGLSELESLGGPRTSAVPARFLVAVAIQESSLQHRYQVGGPAKGFWQFEVAGVTGVMNHPASTAILRRACEAAYVDFDPLIIYRTIEGHDALACALARLLLFTDPMPVPPDEASAWDCYIRLWRPGKPRRGDWSRSWASAPL